MLREAVLALLLGQPAHRTDAGDTPAERAALLTPVAAAVAAAAADAASPEDAAAVLVTIGWYESRWARYVIEGRCPDGPPGERCDPHPRTGRPRATGPWQVWGWCTAAWAAAPGSREALEAGARCAVRRFYGQLARCRGRHPAGAWAGAFAGYRSVDCTWRPGAARARRLEAVRARLAAELAAKP